MNKFSPGLIWVRKLWVLFGHFLMQAREPALVVHSVQHLKTLLWKSFVWKSSPLGGKISGKPIMDNSFCVVEMALLEKGFWTRCYGSCDGRKVKCWAADLRLLGERRRAWARTFPSVKCNVQHAISSELSARWEWLWVRATDTLPVLVFIILPGRRESWACAMMFTLTVPLPGWVI